MDTELLDEEVVLVNFMYELKYYPFRHPRDGHLQKFVRGTSFKWGFDMSNMSVSEAEKVFDMFKSIKKGGFLNG